MGSEAGTSFQQLVDIMARLRAPDGCPWDREQDFDSIKRHTIEETYEVIDAIERKDFPNLCEELGDLILQPVFYAQMAAEAGHFNIDDTLRSINEKLIRRHPHIFGDGQADTAEDVKTKWDEIKAAEKGTRDSGLLDSVNRAQPALMESIEISKKAAKAGFEWENYDDVLAKLREELDELAEARQSGNAADIEGEIGDLLFTVVNLARWAKVDPEQALRHTNTKFRKRFGHVEARLREQEKPIETASLEEMEAFWQEAKQS
ncbi:nucleoside triphosphate pyrophosphohydrolase [Bryobacter aggregatus]|uniref:nucleoside triphosphate pyrophosphohydrolase n=1 Tax=Bryobacter aggregatus TaxID=360054 RepID=UPI0004E22720|nr:nucleoside triphosphate pyrophosphohydrolase [Bryobacter aggregatus]